MTSKEFYIDMIIFMLVYSFSPHSNCPTCIFAFAFFFFFYKFFYFIYLFLAVLGLRCCVWAFSSCSERGLLFVVVRRLIAVASLVVEHGL